MSAESIRDTVCLALRFMSGLLLARVFHRKWSLLMSRKQTHAAFTFTQIELLLYCCCFFLFFPHCHSINHKRVFVIHTHHNVPKSRSAASSVEVKTSLLFLKVTPVFSYWYIASVWCITVKGLEIFTNSPDDIINDKSGFFSTSAVLNASFYNVYYQWFGPGVRLHLGMTRNRFLELSVKDLHVKDRPKADRYK